MPSRPKKVTTRSAATKEADKWRDWVYSINPDAKKKREIF